MSDIQSFLVKLTLAAIVVSLTTAQNIISKLTDGKMVDNKEIIEGCIAAVLEVTLKMQNETNPVSNQSDLDQLLSLPETNTNSSIQNKPGACPIDNSVIVSNLELKDSNSFHLATSKDKGVMDEVPVDH